jgi:hypothetical protein
MPAASATELPPNFITMVCAPESDMAANDSHGADGLGPARLTAFQPSGSSSTRLSLKVGALPSFVSACEVVAWPLLPSG